MTSAASTFDCGRIREAGIAYLETHAQIASTNDRALVVAGDPRVALPALILADEQTAGRGRSENRWWSARGAILASLIFDPLELGIAEDRWPRVSLAAAIAVADLMAELAPQALCQLKWPNDVLLAGRKVAGILVEIPAARPSQRRLVLGMGLNVNNRWAEAPAELAAVGTSIVDATGTPHDLTEVLVRFLRSLNLALEELRTTPDKFAERWRRQCLLTGRQVRLNFGSSEAAGRCHGIDDLGGLVLEVDGECKAFYGGTVVSSH